MATQPGSNLSSDELVIKGRLKKAFEKQDLDTILNISEQYHRAEKYLKKAWPAYETADVAKLALEALRQHEDI